MPKPTKRQKIIANIYKNVRSKKWECIIDGCNETAINSHLLQQNGILDNVAIDGHLIEYKQTDPFTWTSSSSPFKMTKVGKRKAFSLPVFCNSHDTSIFKGVETHPIDIESYRTHLLLSYRVVCAEIRKKERNVELFKRLLNAESLKGDPGLEEIRRSKDGNELGIYDLNRFKKLFENELDNENFNFTFKVYKYPQLDIYGSAVFTPTDYILTDPKQMKPLDAVFIHVVPYNDETNIIVGYNNGYVNSWIKKYVNSWKELDSEGLKKHLTHLFAAHIENWGMSPDLLDRIKPKNMELFKKYTLENINNHSPNQETEFNLFEINE